ncbi:zinc-binding dehydrogenase [bacterium]|nr:zinc-binding dehydrogenase [bacterium]
MRAWQLMDKQRVELQDLPRPEPGPGEVLVKVMACSICSRTDLVYYTYCGLKPHCRPGHFGHEVSGLIEQVGPQVTGWEVGQRVFLRGPGKPGGLAEYCLAVPLSIGRLPDHMSFIEGAPAQQVPIAVNATRTLQLGDHVVIFGAGSAGLQILQAVRLRGAARVVVTDLYEPRLQIARQLGADVCLKADEVDVLAEIARLFPGGPDVVYDAVGIPSVARQCVDCVRSEGMVCIFGTHHVEEQVTFNLVQFEGKAITLHMANEGSAHTRREVMRISERLLANRLIDTRPYITHVFRMEELPRAIELLSVSPILYPEGDPQGQGMPAKEALKVVIQIHEGADRAADGSVFRLA